MFTVRCLLLVKNRLNIAQNKLKIMTNDREQVYDANLIYLIR